MPRVRLAAVLLLAGLLPLNAGALGLGEITLRSALNQPFVAEIPVTLDSSDNLTELSVQLASGATFERFGLDKPRFLEDLRFKVQQEGSRAVVRVTSTQPVSEPFISLLLDVSWPQGRLLREYTVLLDPPAFASPDGQASSGSGTATLPAAAGPAAAAPAIRRPPASGTAASSPSPATGSQTTGPGGETYGPVQSNETLWAISERLRATSGVSLNQMMVALYQTNPEAFAGNINLLRRGAILRVPGAAALAGVNRSAATAEVQRQDAQWRSAPDAAAPATVAPPRLKLVPPTETASGTGAGSRQGASPTPGSPALQQEVAEQQRLLALKDAQLKALQDRVSQLESSKAQPPVVPPPVAAAPPVAEAPVAEQPVADAAPAAVPTAPAVVADEAAPVAPRKPARRSQRDSKGEESGGFLSSLGALVFNVWFLVSAAVVLLAGLFFVFARRRMATADEASSRFADDLRGDLRGAASTQPVMRRDGYSVEEVAGERAGATLALGRSEGRSDSRDGDAETPLERTISTEGAVELDQADVVAEADFHMAYGLYDQAAELLTRALRDNPDRRDLRLKLLEVFFIWENKASFLKEAQTFQRLLKGAADPGWSKVVIMGKQICPDEPLFAGAVSTTGDSGLDLALADEDDRGSVDINFDDGDSAGVDLDLTGARKGPSSGLLDFDLDALESGSGADASLDDTSLMRTEIAPRGGDERSARTTEIPTIETRYGGDYAPTMENPAIEPRDSGGSTMETPTLESAIPGLRPGSADSRSSGGADQTEEINLEDLGLDLTGLDEAAGELGTGVHGAVDGNLDGDGDVYDLSGEDDASDLLEGLEGDSTAEVRGMALDEGTLDLPAFGNAMEKSAAGRDRARDTSGDTAEHRVVEDTAEQPRAAAVALGDASAELSQVDFDIGDSRVEDLEPTSVMPGRRRGPEGPTMTEVGTKLDLARAYVDMGDPDGARSILNEVLEEGDSAQRQEARRLLDELTD